MIGALSHSYINLGLGFVHLQYIDIRIPSDDNIVWLAQALLWRMIIQGLTNQNRQEVVGRPTPGT